MRAAIAPEGAWRHAGDSQHPDRPMVPPGVLLEGHAGWVVRRDVTPRIEKAVPAKFWAADRPGQDWGIVEIPEPAPGKRITGYVIDRAAPSVTLVEEWIDPHGALPVVTDAQIASNINAVVDDLLLEWARRDWDAQTAARGQFVADLTAVVAPLLGAAGRRIGGKGPAILAAAEARLTALSKTFPAAPAGPRP